MLLLTDKKTLIHHLLEVINKWNNDICAYIFFSSLVKLLTYFKCLIVEYDFGSIPHKKNYLKIKYCQKNWWEMKLLSKLH